MIVAIRADSGPSIGIGHVMRCATLAVELVARGHQVAMVAGTIPEFVSVRLQDTGAQVIVGEEALDGVER